MSLGSRVRALAGPLEPALARVYRATFFDLGALAEAVHQRVAAESILEIGCGEGALADEILRRYPRARLVGIDPSPRAGRLFQGDRRRTSFHRASAGELARRSPGAFELVLICDVLHHVPWAEHPALLADAARALRPGGTLVVKEWERRPTPIHLAGYLSDRVVTGDRIRYGHAEEFRRLFTTAFGPGCIEHETRLPPWRNNLAFFLRPGRGRA
jgi:2-polyprenyl-6-hydroxyphenyl methylase/3-demethylubiquinone-9 3-methyltransferase